MEDSDIESQQNGRVTKSRRSVLLIGLEFVEPLFSGNGILTHSVVRALLHLGYQVSVLCARPDDMAQVIHPSFANDIKSHKLIVYSTPVPRSKWRKLDRYSGWAEMASHVSDHSEQLKRHNILASSFSYIFGVDWSAFPTYRALQSANILSSTKISSPPPYINLVFRVFSKSKELCCAASDDEAFYREAETKVLNASDLTIALSHVDANELTSLSSHKALVVLVPPLRQDVITSINTKDGREEKYVICNVRLSPEKNAIAFASIISSISSELQQLGITPVMIGTVCDPVYAAKVTNILPPSTIIVDTFVSPEKLLAYVCHAALMVHPPIYDAFGMTISEAAAVGTPSLIHHTCIGATSLFNTNEVFTTDMEDISEASNAVLSILQSPIERRTVGAAAKARALNWTTVDYANALEKTISEIK